MGRDDHTAGLCPPPPSPAVQRTTSSNVRSDTAQNQTAGSKRDTSDHIIPSPEKKRSRNHDAAGFKTVTVAVPGCPVQQFKICVGNHPDDIKQWIEERKKKFPRQPRVTPLSGLLGSYASSSDEEEQVEKKPSQQEQQKSPGRAAHTHTSRVRVCRYFSRNGRCRNGDSCNFSHEQSQKKPRQISTKTTDETLLQKLLKADAHRETVLSLQLLRHIVDTNWLEQSNEK